MKNKDVQQNVDRLILIGKSKGYVTYDDVNSTLSDDVDSSEELDKIFDTFYQVDSSRKRRYGGCGLGLAISRSVLNLHQGRIWAESTVGLGSKFLFELLTYNETPQG